MAHLKKAAFILLILLSGLSLYGQNRPATHPSTPRLMLPKGHLDALTSAQFSPDGQLALTLSQSLDLTAKVWNTQSGKLLLSLEGHSRDISTANFSPDGDKIITADKGGVVKVWDTHNGRLLHSLEGHSSPVSITCFSPDGTQILTVAKEDKAMVWDAQNGKLLHILQGHSGEVAAACFSPDGTRILIAPGYDNTRVWDTRNGQLLLNLERHTNNTTDARFSPDGTKILTTASWDSTKVWGAQSGELLFKIAGYEEMVGARFSPDGQHILTASIRGQIKFWDAKDGDSLMVFSVSSGKLKDIQYSPDGQNLLTLNEMGAVKLWGTQNASSSLSFGEAQEVFTDVRFSPDGKRIITAGKDGKAKIWNAQNGRLMLSLTGHSFLVSATRFSPDGKYMLMANSQGGLLENDSNIVKSWDIENGTFRYSLEGHNDLIFSIQYSPDGKQVLTASADSTAKAWDAKTGKLLFNITGHYDAVDKAQYSQDGKLILTASWDGTAKVWNASTGGAISKTPRQNSSISLAQFNPNTKQFLTVNDNHEVKIWDAKDGTPLPDLNRRTGKIKDIQFSPDGRYLLTVGEGKAILWNAVDGSLPYDITGDIGKVTTAQFSPNGEHVFTFSDNKTARQWNPENGQLLATFKGYTDIITYAQFSPDGKRLLTLNQNGTFKLWNPLEGKFISVLKNKTDVFYEPEYSPDGSLISIPLDDGALAFWKTESGEPLFSLYSLEGGNWAALHPSGLFDASPGAMAMMYYLVGREVIELEQLKERYYEPGLMQKLLGYIDDPLRAVDGFDTIALYPTVALQLDSLSHQLQIDLTTRNGGIGQASVFINGKEVIEDANPPKGFERIRDRSITVNLAAFKRYFLPDSLNTITVRAYNKAGWLKSPAHTVAYHPSFARAKGNGDDDAPSLSSFQAVEDPALYAIIVGTANYAGEKLDLKYPGKDAAAMAQAFRQAGSQLFEDRVHIRLFTTDTTDAKMHPTKSNIQSAFKAFKEQATAQDILLVYFSGHGVTYGDADRAQFYYLTQDISSENLSDAGIRQSRTLSTAELTKWINDIPALKQVMILDACNSGKVVESLITGTKNLNSSQIRAFDRMKDRTGMYVLSGSAADKVSYEANRYGQGLLTYSLLEGMGGLALSEGQYLDVMTLFQHARNKVPELAESVGGIQTPMMAFPGGGDSFAIGIVNSQVKIPVVQQKPIFVRNVFQEEATFDDVLDIGKKLQGYFQEISAKGASASLIFVDVPEYQDAYSIKGRYSLNGEQIALKGNLFKGRTVLGAIQASSNKDQLDALAEEILNQAFVLMKK